MKIGVLSDTHDQGDLIGNTLSLNPGSLMKETSPTVKGASIAIYDTQAHSATHILF